MRSTLFLNLFRSFWTKQNDSFPFASHHLWISYRLLCPNQLFFYPDLPIQTLQSAIFVFPLLVFTPLDNSFPSTFYFISKPHEVWGFRINLFQWVKPRKTSYFPATTRFPLAATVRCRPTAVCSSFLSCRLHLQALACLVAYCCVRSLGSTSFHCGSHWWSTITMSNYCTSGSALRGRTD
jgi:hypothetical protein